MTTSAKYELAHINAEKLFSSKIPYARLLNDETVETKSGHLLQVIKIEGLYAMTLDDRLIDHEKHIRNFLLMGIADSSISLYFHTIRKQEKFKLDAIYQNDFARSLHEKYHDNLQTKQFYINEHYLTIVKKPPVGGLRGLADIWRALSNKADSEAREVYRENVLKGLNKTTKRVLKTLAHYRPAKLSMIEGAKGQTFSQVLSFLFSLINLDERNIVPTQSDLSCSFSCKRVFFDPLSGTIAFRNMYNQSMYAAVLSIKDYINHSNAVFLDRLFDVPAEFIVAQSFNYLDRTNARKRLEEQSRNQAQSDEGMTSENQKNYQALDDLGSGLSVSGEHHLSVLVKHSDPQILEEQLSRIDSILNQIGVMAIREDRGLKAAYFAMLPGNHAYIARRALLSSKNISGYANLHNTYRGKKTGNYWGEAVTILETINGAPFYFNFHVLDVGSTFFIGSQGSGKTALEAFFVAESLKYGGRAVFFDKDKGLEIFVRAIGGTYSTLRPGVASGFSPFKIPDTLENRSFLIKLIRSIATAKGQILTDEEDALLKQLVDVSYDLPEEKRVLRNLVPTLGTPRSGSLRARFESWVGNGEHAWVFDNDQDHFSLENKYVGFDITEILKNQDVCVPVYFYLFHRIEMRLDGTKTHIVLAEGWRALLDDAFREKVKDWSSTTRKKQALLIIDTQSTADISKSEIGCKIIQETATQIYFANPQALREEYIDKFGLTEKELEIIKGLSKEERFFLLKQGKTSVVVRADFSIFEKEMAVLSGRATYSKLLDQLRGELGDGAKDWLESYYEKVPALDEGTITK